MLKRKSPCAFLCSGALVIDSSTKQLCKRIQPGQIALIQHEDVDEVAAEALKKARVRAVINTFPFLTGKYPAIGAKRLLEAGIPMFEVVDRSFEEMMCLSEGMSVVIHEQKQYFLQDDSGNILCHLQRVTEENINQKWDEAQDQMESTLSHFIDNTLMYASWEKELFLKPLNKLPLLTKMEDRHVVVIVRGQHYQQDLRALTSYLHECKPVLLAVDGGADALLEQGYVPDIIIGDMDSVSDWALGCGAEIVVHAFPNGDAPGRQRVEKQGIPHYHVLPAPGTSEDVAMLLAYEENAKIIVTIGTHNHMIDFLEKGRKGMASTLLVRTKIGSKLVDAKGVSQLYLPRITWNVWLLFIAAIFVPFLAVFTINPVTRHAATMLWMQLKTAF